MAATDGDAAVPEEQAGVPEEQGASADQARTANGAGAGDLAKAESGAVTAGGGSSVVGSGGGSSVVGSGGGSSAAGSGADLEALLADLPAAPSGPGPAPAVPGPGRYAIALKSSVRRAGRWRVPERYTTVVYKGGGWLDLRAAELSGPVTTFLAVAYKSQLTILVPPNVRVEMTGLGVSQDTHDEDPGYRLPADAPVIHVRGIAYKGTVEIATRPPERPALRQ